MEGNLRPGRSNADGSLSLNRLERGRGLRALSGAGRGPRRWRPRLRKEVGKERGLSEEEGREMSAMKSNVPIPN